ncbi:MAG: hypothetical protein M0Z75_16920 [Nitrospiraceae bacterium]|nr:hypothetical protein [Nitrospiraceae bacterium]
MSILEERRKLIADEMEVGRGSAFVYDYPVSLEPPFKPFSFRPEKRSLFDSLFQHRDKTPQSLPDNLRHGRLNFIRIKPSREDKYSLDIAEQFILALPVSSPIAFEIIGQGGKIRFQIVSEENQAPSIISQVSSHFPGADVYPEEDLLNDVLSANAVARAYRLKNTHFLPLNVNGSADPYRTLFGCLANLDRGRVGAFQILFAPVTQNWLDNIYKASRNQYDPSQSPFFDIPKLPAIVDKKLSKILYAASIRMLATDETLLVNMESFLKQADNGENGIIPVGGNYPVRSIIDRNTHVHGSILNSTELAYFLHLPAPDVLDSIYAIEQAAKSYPAHEENTLDGPVLGYNLHRGVKKAVHHSRHLPNRHIIVIGDSGEGKTNFILWLLIQMSQSNEGIGVVDPHGSLSWELLRRIPKERKDDVVFFNAADFDFPMIFNPLANRGTKLEREIIREDIIDICESLSEVPLGVNVLHVLNFSVITLLTRPDSILQDIERLLLDKKWRSKFLASIEDDRIQMFWELEFPLLERRGIVTSITNKLSSVLLPDSAIAPMLAQRENKIDFIKIMNDKKILICNLALGKFGKKNGQILGKLLVSRLNISAMMREEGRQYPDFYLFLDEAQTILSKSIADTLSGGRKFGLHILLANQMAGDIPDSIMRHAFNASTLISFATDNPHNQMLMEKTFAKKFTAEDRGRLKKGETLVKMGTSVFNMKTELVPDPPSVNWVDEIIATSRAKYTAKSTKDEPAEKAKTFKQRESRESKSLHHDTPMLSPQEKNFLECVFKNPTLYIVGLYKEQGLSAYMGDKIKKNLKDKGLITEIATHLGPGSRLVKFVSLTPQGFNSLGVDLEDNGKGGPLHRYWQSVVKRYAEAKGYNAVIEESIPESNETVDLSFKKQDKRIAIEISISNKAEREIDNARKCLDAGFDQITVLFLREDKMLEFADRSLQSFSDEERARISTGLLSEFCRFIN